MLVTLNTPAIFEPFETFVFDTAFAVIHSERSFKVLGLRDSLTPIARVLFSGDIPFGVQTCNFLNSQSNTTPDKVWVNEDENSRIEAMHTSWHVEWRSYLDNGGLQPNMFCVHIEEYNSEFKDQIVVSSKTPAAEEKFSKAYTELITLLAPILKQTKLGA
jgi:hypothetical protein